MHKYRYTIVLSLAAITSFHTPTKAADKTNTYIHGEAFHFDANKIKPKKLKKALLEMSQKAVLRPHGKWYNTVIARWLHQSGLQLQQEDIARILSYAKKNVYFFIGPTGSGKSTAIYALQGNTITKDKVTDDDDWGNFDDENKIGLQYQRKVKVKVPKIGDSAEGETKGSIIYYHGDKTKNIAFCDTEGFLGQREATEEEKCTSSFSPFFALKTNTIGGIVFVVSAADIEGSKGHSLKKNAQFIHKYFSAATKEELRASILFMITKTTKAKKEVAKELGQVIQLSYKHAYKTFKRGAQKLKENHEEKKDEGEGNLAELKPFFEMMLEKDVAENEIGLLENFQLDKKRILFFDPCSQQHVNSTLDRLFHLAPLAHTNLCEFDDPLSQYLRAQIKQIGNELNEMSNNTLNLKARIKAQSLQLRGKKGTDELQAYIQAQKQVQVNLKKRNNTLSKDTTMECVFEENHIEELPLDKKCTSIKEGMGEGMDTVGKIAYPLILPCMLSKDLLGISEGLGGYGMAERTMAFLVGVPLFAVSYPIAVASLATIAAIGVPYGAAKTAITGYCAKTFIYEGKEPIYKIEATYENADLRYIQPKEAFFTKNFSIQKIGARTIKFTATANHNSIVQDCWSLYHVTGYGMDANCHIRMYAKKNELSATKKEIENNQKKIQTIQNNIDNWKKEQNDIEALTMRYNQNKKNLKTYVQRARKEKEKAWMLDCWQVHIFKQGSTDARLLRGYVKNFQDATQLNICTLSSSPAPNWEEDEKDDGYPQYDALNSLPDHYQVNSKILTN